MLKNISKEARIDVAEQIINMLENDIVEGNGGESLTGWLEDGEVFRNNGLTEDEVEERMALVRKIETHIAEVVFALDYIWSPNLVFDTEE